MIGSCYDVAVIGAGPAGAMAALHAARRGASVLLLEKRKFPRDKVCGCCVNGAALTAMETAGLSHLPRRLAAQPLRTIELRAGLFHATLRLPGSYSISRAALDTALVEAAVAAGAQFVDQVSARPGPVDGSARAVSFGRESVRARCLIVASGLGQHQRARGPGRIGLSNIVSASDAIYPAGAIHMACGAQGYVGLVRLEDNRLDVAAALDPAFIRARGGPAQAVRHVLESCRVPVPSGLSRGRWRGTPLLHQTRGQVADERLFVVGDAAGYVEPFTGEGIAWALAGGWAAGDLASRPWQAGAAALWASQIAQLRRRQWTCKAVAALLRRPAASRAVIAALSIAPGLARPVVRGINRAVVMDSAATAT